METDKNRQKQTETDKSEGSGWKRTEMKGNRQKPTKNQQKPTTMDRNQKK